MSPREDVQVQWERWGSVKVLEPAAFPGFPELKVLEPCAAVLAPQQHDSKL